MHKMSPLPSGEIERSETHRVERSEMHSRVRLKIPPFDRLRVVSEVEPPEAG